MSFVKQSNTYFSFVWQPLGNGDCQWPHSLHTLYWTSSFPRNWLMDRCELWKSLSDAGKLWLVFYWGSIIFYPTVGFFGTLNLVLWKGTLQLLAYTPVEIILPLYVSIIFYLWEEANKVLPDALPFPALIHFSSVAVSVSLQNDNTKRKTRKATALVVVRMRDPAGTCEWLHT